MEYKFFCLFYLSGYFKTGSKWRLFKTLYLKTGSMYEVLILKQERYILNLKKNFFFHNFFSSSRGAPRRQKKSQFGPFFKTWGLFFSKVREFYFLEIIILLDLKNVVNHRFCLHKPNRIPQRANASRRHTGKCFSDYVENQSRKVFFF